MLAFIVGVAAPLALISWRLGAHASPAQIVTHTRALQQGRTHHHDSAGPISGHDGVTTQGAGLHPLHVLKVVEAGAGPGETMLDVGAVAMASQTQDRAATGRFDWNLPTLLIDAQALPQPARRPPILCL